MSDSSPSSPAAALCIPNAPKEIVSLKQRIKSLMAFAVNSMEFAALTAAMALSYGDTAWQFMMGIPGLFCAAAYVEVDLLKKKEPRNLLHFSRFARFIFHTAPLAACVICIGLLPHAEAPYQLTATAALFASQLLAFARRMLRNNDPTPRSTDRTPAFWGWQN